jgi:hypothetical protein
MQDISKTDLMINQFGSAMPATKLNRLKGLSGDSGGPTMAIGPDGQPVFVSYAQFLFNTTSRHTTRYFLNNPENNKSVNTGFASTLIYPENGKAGSVRDTSKIYQYSIVETSKNKPTPTPPTSQR